MLVEGAGGVMSPATDKITHIDMMAHLRLPIIFVSDVYLGAVSHSLTALEALDRRDLTVSAIVINQASAASTAPEALAAELSRFRNEPFFTLSFGGDATQTGEALFSALIDKDPA